MVNHEGCKISKVFILFKKINNKMDIEYLEL